MPGLALDDLGMLRSLDLSANKITGQQFAAAERAQMLTSNAPFSYGCIMYASLHTYRSIPIAPYLHHVCMLAMAIINQDANVNHSGPFMMYLLMPGTSGCYLVVSPAYSPGPSSPAR